MHEPKPERELARRHEAGMTLIEIMVVVAIISMVMGGIGLTAYKQWEKARVKTAHNDVIALSRLVESYRVQHRGRCPQNAAALVQSGLTGRVRKDPWGNEFRFACEGPEVVASSAGPDGEHDSEDDIRSDRNSPDDPDDQDSGDR